MRGGDGASTDVPITLRDASDGRVSGLVANVPSFMHLDFTSSVSLNVHLLAFIPNVPPFISVYLSVCLEGIKRALTK